VSVSGSGYFSGYLVIWVSGCPGVWVRVSKTCCYVENIENIYHSKHSQLIFSYLRNVLPSTNILYNSTFCLCIASSQQRIASIFYLNAVNIQHSASHRMGLVCSHLFNRCSYTVSPISADPLMGGGGRWRR
jgi:hypothetical protein